MTFVKSSQRVTHSSDAGSSVEGPGTLSHWPSVGEQVSTAVLGD